MERQEDAPARLTLPRWSGAATPLPPARCWHVLALCRAEPVALTGSCALPIWESTSVVVEPVVPVAAQVAALLAAARLGDRLAVCGSESDVAEAVAAARRCGLLGDEIVAHSHGATDRRVYCPACATVGPQTAETVCHGCGCRLLVHRHFAEARGAYLATPQATA